MLFGKKIFHLFFGLFFVHKVIAFERFYLLKSKALWIKARTDKNDQPASKYSKTVSQYFKNKLPPLSFYKSYLIICDQRTNNKIESYQHLGSVNEI